MAQWLERPTGILEGHGFDSRWGLRKERFSVIYTLSKSQSIYHFFHFVTILLIPRKRTQPWTDCLSHKSSMDIASVISFFSGYGPEDILANKLVVKKECVLTSEMKKQTFNYNLPQSFV